jgi:hypothetical protein
MQYAFVLLKKLYHKSLKNQVIFSPKLIFIISLSALYSAFIMPPILPTSVFAMDRPSPVEWCAASTV